jgi:hypothetical protein
MDFWLQTIMTLVLGFIGSSGFWAFMQYKKRSKDDKEALQEKKLTQTDLLLQGLAYGQIVFQGMEYIKRGYITNDEYEDFRRYLYDPYIALGGNGSAERIMSAVSDLPLRPREYFSQVIQAAKIEGEGRRDTADSDRIAEAA